MCLAQGHSTMTVEPRLGIEPGTPGFEIPNANHSTTADSYIHDSFFFGYLNPESIGNIKIILILERQQHVNDIV